MAANADDKEQDDPFTMFGDDSDDEEAGADDPAAVVVDNEAARIARSLVDLANNQRGSGEDVSSSSGNDETHIHVSDPPYHFDLSRTYHDLSQAIEKLLSRAPKYLMAWVLGWMSYRVPALGHYWNTHPVPDTITLQLSIRMMRQNS